MLAKSHWILLTFHQENVLTILSPVAEAKSIKNEAETEGFRQCHIRDGAALVRILLSSIDWWITQRSLTKYVDLSGPILLMAWGTTEQWRRIDRVWSCDQTGAVSIVSGRISLIELRLGRLIEGYSESWTTSWDFPLIPSLQLDPMEVRHWLRFQRNFLSNELFRRSDHPLFPTCGGFWHYQTRSGRTPSRFNQRFRTLTHVHIALGIPLW